MLQPGDYSPAELVALSDSEFRTTILLIVHEWLIASGIQVDSPLDEPAFNGAISHIDSSGEIRGKIDLIHTIEKRMGVTGEAVSREHIGLADPFKIEWLVNAARRTVRAAAACGAKA